MLKAKAPSKRLLLLALSALSAMAPLAIDVVLPGFHSIELDFSLAPGAAASTMSVFLVGFALGPLAFGAISDRVGRRPLLLLGLIVFTAASLMCLAAPNFATLLVARFVEGVGAGAAAALPIAIVRDLMEGQEAGEFLSLMTSVGSFAPIVAPLVGVLLATNGGWHAIFIALSIGGALLFVFSSAIFRESLQPGNRQSGGLGSILRGYSSALRQPTFLAYSLANAFNFATMFAYVSASPSVFIETFNVSIFQFGCAFAITAAGIIAGGLWNTRELARGIVSSKLLERSLIISFAASLALLALCLSRQASIVAVLPLLIANNISIGMARPNATYEAMRPMPHIAGTASALLRGMQMLMGAGASAIISLLHGRDAPLVMALVMTLTSLLALLFCQAGRLWTPRYT